MFDAIGVLMERGGSPVKSKLVILVPALACGACATPTTSKSQATPEREANVQVSLAPAQAQPKTRPDAPAVAASKPVAPAVPDLMPGTDCTTAKMPELKYDIDEHRVQLANGGFKMRLPKRWKVELERADLAVITSPDSNKGLRPVFELFVSPVCKKYESFVVHRRVAARGLVELLPTEETIAQIANGHWNVGLGGQVGQNLILQDVTLKTKKGERRVIVYATQLGDAKSFGLRAAAVCPKPGKKEGPLGKCEKTYFDMLAKAEL
jgi:hypothetical protein